MSTAKNNSKYYYLSNENMSNIKESIEEYSMNFDKESNAQSKYHQSISEDIQYSKTNKLASQSLADKNKSKKSIKPPATIPLEQPPAIKQTRTENSEPSDIHIDVGPQIDRPIDLGFQVWQTIQERYYQTNKISTDDPDVLYDFFLLQKKTVLFALSKIKPRNEKTLKQEYQKLGKLMPSMQRKMQLKLDFERMLIFRPNDVLYTLQVAAHMKQKDRQLRKNQNILNSQIKKTEKKKKPIKQVVNRLYGEPKIGSLSKTNLKDAQLQRIKLHQFGKKLSEAYQNAMRDLPENRAETLSRLHNFWSQLYEREEYGLEWDEEKVEKDIRTYMIQQVEILKAKYQRKIGYSQENGNKLLKFLAQNPNLPDLYIPANSFEGYVEVFNLDRKEKEQHLQKVQNQQEEKHKNSKAQLQLKKFGRPVSATPLTILSKPKSSQDYSDIYTKYGNDKLVNTLMLQDKFKMHRYPFEYGVYDIVEEIKIKGRVKPSKKQDFDDAINKMLTKTVMNQSSFQMTTRLRDRVTDILQQENLFRNDTWKEMGLLLKEAMLVKSHEQEWFRDPIVKYIKQTTTKDLSLKQDKYVFNELFNYLNNLDEDDRQSQISKLQNFISISQKIQDKGKQMKKLENKDEKFYMKQRRLMYADLVERAIQFQRLKHDARVGKSEQKVSTRDFLNQTFALLVKSHKEAVYKYFNVVDIKGDKNCPSLLRYQFYRILKEINPLTFERDEKPRAPAWVATKTNPDSFNYKTFNKYANTYKKDRNRLIGDPQPQKRSQSLWGQKKTKERQRLLMTYSDAKQCYFHPKVKKLQ